MANSNIHSCNTSGFKGVSYFKRTGRWKASITVGDKARHIGYYQTPELAADAYDAEAVAVFGEFARTNRAIRESQGALL